MPFRKPRRLPPSNYVGERAVSLTICTNDRAHHFTSALIVEAVLLRFRQHARHELVALLAYCFMPDHLHLLVSGGRPDADVGRFLTRAKQSSGHWFSVEFGARLWQRYAWDRVLRHEEDTLSAIRYLLANPVRAGLVQHPLEYPFSGSDVYSHEDLLSAFDRRAG